MPYPFLRSLTFEEFKNRLEDEFDCEFDDLKVQHSDGESYPVRYFQRKVDDKIIRCVVSFTGDEEIVSPSLVRSICNNLKIDTSAFGLNLG